jgi:hypothetical protein
MSLHIYIAHSGEHLLADPVAFASYVATFDEGCLVGSRAPNELGMQANAVLTVSVRIH